MTVGIVGSGPAIESVEAMLAGGEVPAERADPGDVGGFELAVVIGRVGASAFEAANETALAAGAEWIGVELGGIGGHALEDVEAAICGFGSGAVCFECLCARVAANVGDRRTVAELEDIGDSDGAIDGPTDSSDATARFAGSIAGRKLRQVLAGASVTGLVELPYTERRVLAVPGCVCADEEHSGEGEREESGGRFGGLDREHEKRELSEAVARAERALDPRVGIVRSIGEAASFPVPYYLATLGDTTAFSDAQATPRAAGVAIDWNEAFMKAIGEAIERYCAGVYRTEELPTGAPNDLDRAVAPAAFVQPERRDGMDFGGDEPIRWVPGEALATGTEVLLPAALALFPPPEERYRPTITTGLGLGNSGVEALLSGLYEVIERDATMLGWYSTFEPLGLDVESRTFEALRRRARAVDLSVTTLLVTQDVDVPVVAATVHRESEWPRFAVGSGADRNATRAAESALGEALQNWTELREMGVEGASNAEGAIARYASLPAAAQEFVDVERSIPAASIGIDVESSTAELNAITERLVEAGLDAYATRLTTQDVAGLGFEAVRVVVPEAQPLFTGEAFFGERARMVPESLGFEPQLDRELHPYP